MDARLLAPAALRGRHRVPHLALFRSRARRGCDRRPADRRLRQLRASSFAIVSRSVEKALAARRTRCASSRRALGLGLRHPDGLFGGQRRRLDAGDFLSKRVAVLGNVAQLCLVRRLRRDVLDLRIERCDLPRHRRDEILALGKRGFEAPELGACFSGPVRNLGEMRVGLYAAGFGTFEVRCAPPLPRRRL